MSEFPELPELQALSAKQLVAMPPLPTTFYQRSTVAVAKDLLGKGLVVRFGKETTAVQIVEVEAYLGDQDPAAHTYRGETPRNHSMFAGGGTCYVYISYGMHHCMNVVTGDIGSGEAVLLRAAAPLCNWQLMSRRRGLPDSTSPPKMLLDGPGKLTQSLGISLIQDGWRFDQPHFKIVDLNVGGSGWAKRHIAVSPRIGITKAADLALRFYQRDSRWLSRRHAEAP